jgi:hypothetical protein
MTLDSKLRWKTHVKKIREELGQENVLAHGKKLGPVDTQQADAAQILNPVWTKSMQLWGCTKQSNNDIIQ